MTHYLGLVFTVFIVLTLFRGPVGIVLCLTTVRCHMEGCKRNSMAGLDALMRPPAAMTTPQDPTITLHLIGWGDRVALAS